MPSFQQSKLSPAPSARYVRRFTLHNVRTFRSPVVVDFCHPDGKVAQWTVILGENGTGKTTLLQYLAGMIPVLKSGQANGKHSTKPQFQFAPLFESLDWRPWHRGNWPTPEWKWVLEHSKPGTDYVGFIKGELEYSVPASKLEEAFAEDPKTRPLFLNLDIWVKNKEARMNDISWSVTSSFDLPSQFKLFAYGAGRHVAGPTSPYVTSQTFFEQRGNEPTSSLYHDDFPLITPEQWLLGLDHTRRSRDSAVRKPAARAFANAARCLSHAMPDIAGFAVKPHQVSDSSPVMMLMCQTPYGEVPFSALSVGYKTMAAWLTDFIKRMHEAYPEMDVPDNGPAVVLIDEFDLHMHPKWQRRAMSALSKEFPNTQFIVTAHSPLIVQATEGDARIIVLRRKQREDGGEEVEVINEPHYAAGWRIDQILASDLYDLPARSSKYSALMAERICLRQKDRRRPAEDKRLREIEKELESEAPPESAPGSDKLFVKLEHALDRAEAKQKKE